MILNPGRRGMVLLGSSDREYVVSSRWRTLSGAVLRKAAPSALGQAGCRARHYGRGRGGAGPCRARRALPFDRCRDTERHGANCCIVILLTPGVVPAVIPGGPENAHLAGASADPMSASLFLMWNSGNTLARRRHARLHAGWQPRARDPGDLSPTRPRSVDRTH